jgi:hypothetical protein
MQERSIKNVEEQIANKTLLKPGIVVIVRIAVSNVRK